MMEIAPNIFYIPGKNKSRFPYCACLYIKGKDKSVLVDAGMGTEKILPVKEMGIDILLLTHSHLDHRLTRKEIPEVPVWCHEREEQYIKDVELFIEGLGIEKYGLDLSHIHRTGGTVFNVDISRRLKDGDSIDLGGLTLEIIHTPGHTPGHFSVFIPEHSLLFAGDIDLTNFGPFYGHDYADINNFVESIQKLRKINAGIVATSHAGPFRSDIDERFEAYEGIIYKRESMVLEYLNRPMKLDEFKGHNLIYRSYPQEATLVKVFELVHIEKHLKRLSMLGEVRENSDKTWVRC